MKVLNYLIKIAIVIVVIIILYIFISSKTKGMNNPLNITSWNREISSATEYITFGNNNSFSYRYAGGGAIAGFENCNKYKYDDKTKIITLECGQIKKEIEYVAINYDTLVVKINNENINFNRVRQ